MSEQRHDLYAVLGLERSADAEAVKKAYRAKAKACHPDKHPGADADEKRMWATRFNEVQFAHSILSDVEKRAQYDRFGLSAFKAFLDHARAMDPHLFASAMVEAAPYAEAGAVAGDAAVGYARLAGAAIVQGDFRTAIRAGKGTLDAVGTVIDSVEMMGDTKIGRFLSRLRKK